MSKNGEDEVNTELLAKILSEVKASTTYSDDTIQELFRHLVAECNKYPGDGGTIAFSGFASLFMEIRPALDKLVFGVLDGSSLHPISQFGIRKPIRMGKYHVGLFLVPVKE